MVAESRSSPGAFDSDASAGQAGTDRSGGETAVGRPAIANMRIRPMLPSDLRQVLRIERLVYPRPWSAGIFSAELSAPADRRYLVARGRDPDRARWAPARLYGYAGLLIHAGDAHVTTVAVDPAHHRRKVATHLMLALMTAAREMGARAATLEARVANRGAQRLYAAFGFAPVGVRPGYYSETGEDALVMWAHDLQSAGYASRLADQRRRLDLPGGSSGASDLPVPWVRGRVGLLLAPDNAASADAGAGDVAGS